MAGPKVIGYVCRWSVSDLDGKLKAMREDGVRMVQLNCIANLTASTLTKVFTKGADVVILLGCGGPNCKFYDGWNKADRTVKGIEAMLQDLGLEPERLMLAVFDEDKDDTLQRVKNEALEKAKALGPSPYASSQ